MDNASTTFHNTLNVENVSVGGSLSVTGSIEGYQETLIAGTNITITGNTISSAGSGGTLPANANFSSVNTSTLNASTIDSSGDVSIGGIISAPNQVSFKATTNVALRTINNNVIPDFENVVYNIGGGYDNTTYKFTAPVAGKYFLGVIFYTNEENKFTLDLLLNNTTLLTRAKRQFAVTEGGYTTFEIICFHNLNVGDVVYSKVTQSSSIAINAGGSNGFFGFLIS